MQPEKDFPQHAADNLLARDAHPFPTLDLTVTIHSEDTYGTAEVDRDGVGFHGVCEEHGDRSFF